jgi:hypothetical protein
MNLFKELTEEETKEYQQWARENYVPLTPINGVWHPVIQAECAKINAMTGK